MLVMRKKLQTLLVGFLVVGVIGLILWSSSARGAQAAWFDDNWGYRVAVPVTAHTSLETSKYWTPPNIDTTDSTKFSSTCGNVRWTDASGKVLPYYVFSGCGGASTVFHVFLDNFPAGAQTFYYYYGNTGARDGRSLVDFASAATGVTNGTAGSEEKGLGPVAFWRFDDATGTVAKDSSSNGNSGTLAGSTLPTWQTQDLCVLGDCLYFNGVTSNVTAGTATGVQTVSFWVKPASASASLIQLASGKDIKATSGVLDSDGITVPTFYVNGQPSKTFTANRWNFVVVTTGTSFTADAILLGKMQTGVLNGFLDEVKLYNYARSAAQVKLDYNNSGINKGAGTELGSDPRNAYLALSQGLVGYWKMNDTSDASGNGTTLTNNNAATFTPGKFDDSATLVTASSQYFSAVDNPAMSVAASSFTIGSWVNITTTTNSAVDSPILTKVDSSPAVAYEYYTRYNGNNAFQFFLRQASDNVVKSVTAQSFGIPTASTWHYYLAWYDSEAQTLNIQIDNGPVDKTTGVSPGADGTSSFRIGTALSSPVDYFGGKIDEARVYNRVLSGAERSALYNFAPGPTAYWNFEEGSGTTASDTSGFGNDLTMSGDFWTQGQYGKAFLGTGANWASRTNDDDFNFVADDIFTISGWFKSGSANNPAANQALVEKQSGGVGYAVYLGTGGKLNFGIDSNPAGGTFTITDLASSLVDIYDGNWHHFEGIKSGTSKIELYIDGAFNGADNSLTSNGTLVNSGDLVIGDADAVDDGDEFVGKMDEVRIYRYGRTVDQITEDLNGGHPFGGSPVSSMQDFWKLDEGQGYYSTSSGIQRTTGTMPPSVAVPASVGVSGWNPSGKFGKAISFDGVNDYMDVGDLAYTEGISTMSASLWVNPSLINQKKCLLCKFQQTSAANKESWGLESGVTNGNAVLFELSTDGNAATASGETPAGALAVGRWTHVVVVYDGGLVGNANRLKIYINGVIQNLTFSGTIPSATWATTSNVRAGSSSDSTAARLFTGSLDEIKIYSGALSEAQIKVDYNHGSAIALGVLGTSTLDGKSASNSAGAAYCVPGDTTSCTLPVAEWKFEEKQGTSAFDTSGNGLTGTLTGSPTWGPGEIGSGVVLNGSTNDYISVADNSLLNITGDLTVEAWVKPSIVDTAARLILEKGDGVTSTNRQYSMRMDTTPAWVVTIYDGSNTRNALSKVTPVVGKWDHITLLKRSTTLYIYVNGVQSGLVSAPNATNTSSSILAIGRPGASSSNYFKGTVDQVKIFNYARSDAQIAYDYNRGAPQSWWKFDECQGTVAHDSAGTVSGTLNSGTAGTCSTSSTAWLNGVTGKYNSAGSFGSAPNFTTATSTNTYPFSLVTSTNASWGGWFKPTSSINDQGLVDKDNQFRLFTSVSGKPTCSTYHGAAYNDAVAGVTALTLNSWNHVICTYDGTNIRTYLNGQLVGTTGDSTAISVATSNLRVGQISGGTPKQFTGLADDVKVWAYPLTGYQVGLDFNQGSAIRFGPVTGSP